MEIKFIGDFKELKKMGYSFHKLYASNYKVYEKNKIWIWVAGKYIEISDLYNNSHAVAKRIVDNTYPVHLRNKDYGVFVIKKGESKMCRMEYKTGKIYSSREVPFPYDTEIFRELFLPSRTLQTIKKLHELNMLSL